MAKSEDDGRYTDTNERVHIPSEEFEGVFDPGNNSVELLRKGFVGESIKFHKDLIPDLTELLGKLKKEI